MLFSILKLMQSVASSNSIIRQQVLVQKTLKNHTVTQPQKVVRSLNCHIYLTFFLFTKNVPYNIHINNIHSYNPFYVARVLQKSLEEIFL